LPGSPTRKRGSPGPRCYASYAVRMPWLGGYARSLSRRVFLISAARRAGGVLTLVGEPCGGVDTPAQLVVPTPIPCVLALPLTRRTPTISARTRRRWGGAVRASGAWLSRFGRPLRLSAGARRTLQGVTTRARGSEHCSAPLRLSQAAVTPDQGHANAGLPPEPGMTADLRGALSTS
jgi:hypothetical protein